jgi:ATP-dependent helicase HrpA
MQRDDSHVQGEQYPDHIKVAGMLLPLGYHFEPGKKNDGVSVRVPAAALNQLHSKDFDYLVPGMLQEKVVAFIRKLPKQVRKQFVPAPEYAKACLESLPQITGKPITEAIAKALRRMTGHRIDTEILQNHVFEDHHRMRFEVVDEAGKVIKTGRDLEALKQLVGNKLSSRTSQAKTTGRSHSLEREAITEWDFEVLDEHLLVDVSGIKIKAWPALVDKGDSVSIQLFDSPKKAQQQQGLLRLLLLHLASDKKAMLKNLPGIQNLCLKYNSTGNCDELKKSIVRNVFRLTFVADDWQDKQHGVGIEQAQFLNHIDTHRNKLDEIRDALCQQLSTVLGLNHDIRKQLKGTIDLSLLETLNDIKDQLQSLVYPGFLDELNLDELRQYPRYLKAILRRLDKLAGQAHKDRERFLEIQPLWEDYKAHIKKHGKTPASQQIRWMLEEFRVSLFAQDLGTAYPVSAKRLSKAFNEILLHG